MPDSDGYGPDPYNSGSGNLGQIAGYAPAVLGTGLGIYNTVSSGSRSKKTREHEKEMADLAWQRGLDAWAMQNEYNSPEAQMARLKAAGLNPKLIYGNGVTATGQADKIAPYQAPRAEYSSMPLQLPVLDEISKYQDIQIRQAQKDLLQEQIITERTNNKYHDMMMFYGLQEAQGKDIKNHSLDANQMYFKEWETRIKKMESGTAKTKAEVEFQNAFNKAIKDGVNLRTDSLLTRAIYQAVKNISPSKLFDKAKSTFQKYW